MSPRPSRGITMKTAVVLFVVIVAALTFVFYGSDDPLHASSGSATHDATGRGSSVVASLPRALPKLVPVYDVPTAQPMGNAAALPRGVRPMMRLMFVGDSITEGIFMHHAQPLRALTPPEGSCSYRFPLMRLLEHKGVAVVPVGPFTGVVGSRSAQPNCRQQLKHFLTGASDRHGAVWGVTAAELLGPASLQKKRQFARRFYFGKRLGGVAPLDESVGPYSSRSNLPEVVRHAHLRRWATVYQPELIVTLVGTNDLATGAQVETLVLQLLPNVLHALLFPEYPMATDVLERAASVTPVRCTRRVGLATLLPRNMPLQLLVDDVNDWMGRIQDCKQQHLGDIVACGACVASYVPTLIHGSTVHPDGYQKLSRRAPILPSERIVKNAATAWCYPCSSILNVSDPWRIDASKRYMYDGLHPNAAGEDRLAELMLEAMEQNAML